MLNIFPEQVSFGNGSGHKQNNALAAAAIRVSNSSRFARFGPGRQEWIHDDSRGNLIVFVKCTLGRLIETLYGRFNRTVGSTPLGREEPPG
jgi:hypothetical protein